MTDEHRTNPADNLTGRDGSGLPKPGYLKAPDAHPGMTHRNDGNAITGLSRTEGQRLIDTIKNVQIDPTAIPAADKNIASAPAEPHPGMNRARADEYNADRAAGLGAAILDEAVQRVRKPDAA